MLMKLFHSEDRVLVVISMGVSKIFPGRGGVNILLIPFQAANDAMQMDLHKTLSTPQRKFCGSTRSVRILRNHIEVE